MSRDSKHYPDDEPIPLSAWWLLNGAGKPPTWAQLERGAAARRRESPMSHMKPNDVKAKKGEDRSGQKGTGKEQNGKDAGAGAEQAAGTKAEKKGRPGAPGTRPRGTGTFRRLMNRLQKRPAKRPASSDLAQQDNPASEVGQAPEQDTSHS